MNITYWYVLGSNTIEYGIKCNEEYCEEIGCAKVEKQKA